LRFVGGCLETSPKRFLVVEDSEAFRNFICSTLEKRPELQTVGAVTDGLQAVQKAEELRPDLIVLDIGLPSLNGIEVARRIRKLSPESRILFLSQEFSADVVQAALGTGAHGYVTKTDAGRELLTAVAAVLRGEYFVSKKFSGHDFIAGSDEVASQEFLVKNPFAQLDRNMEIACVHQVGFYSNDRLFLDDVTQFIVNALQAGNATIVVATEAHRSSLLLRMEASGVDTSAAIEQGKYLSVDVADAVSKFVINGMLDPARFLSLFGDLIMTAADAKGKPTRVAVFGEGVHLLWAQGSPEAAIQIERLCNQLARTYDVDILCGYFLGIVQGGMDNQLFQRICAEHSAVHAR